MTGGVLNRKSKEQREIFISASRASVAPFEKVLYDFERPILACSAMGKTRDFITFDNDFWHLNQ